MKYSPFPTLIVAMLLAMFQFFELEEYATKSTVYFIGIVILASISITISSAKDKSK